MKAQEAKEMSRQYLLGHVDQDFDLLLTLLYALIRGYADRGDKVIYLYHKPSKRIIDRLIDDGYDCRIMKGGDNVKAMISWR